MPPKRRRRRGFGAIRKLPSGRFQASYVGPDANRYTAPDTFDASIDAEAWLAMVRARIAAGAWRSPAADAEAEADRLTVGQYAEDWLEQRDLRPTTRRIYRHALDRYILPTFASMPLEEVNPTRVSRWDATVRRQTGPTQAAHAYSLLSTIFNAAVRSDLVDKNPCRVPGAGTVRRASVATVLEPHELSALAAAAPDDLRALILLAGWCGLRLGELLELRRRDVDVARGTIVVRRQVQHLTGQPPLVGPPKSTAGVRTVHLPAHVTTELAQHLERHAAPGRDGLLFPGPNGGHRVPSTTRRAFKTAAANAGHSELKIHDLRHTAAVMAARTGATVAELQARLGHASPKAAMRYQHAAQDRDRYIAEALSALAREDDR